MNNNNKDKYDKIFNLLNQHHNWFKNSIPLIASENVSSPAVREAVASDFGHRYAEGWPGERVYAGCKFIDKVELECIELAKQVFNAEFVDVRPVSGVCANLAVYSAFTKPNDIMMALPIPSGGHISHGRRDFYGTAGLVHGLEIEYFAFDKEEMNIDVDKTKDKIKTMIAENKAPKLIMFGGSVFLFPHPIKELADFLKSNNMSICYDSAHVSGLIAGGEFQDPLREGADVMTLSTHKTLFGPQGGMIISVNKYEEQIKNAVFPGNTSSHHLNTVAGKAVALTEILEFGKSYAKETIKNAQYLAEKLYENNIIFLGEKNGFTKSHQVVLNTSKYEGGGILEDKLERANIIVNRQLIPGDIKAGRHYRNPGGLRLGTSEVTRLGMGKSEMIEIANFITRIIIKNEDINKVKNDVINFRKEFQNIKYTFNENQKAHEHFNLRDK